IPFVEEDLLGQREDLFRVIALTIERIEERIGPIEDRTSFRGVATIADRRDDAEVPLDDVEHHALAITVGVRAVRVDEGMFTGGDLRTFRDVESPRLLLGDIGE